MRVWLGLVCGALCAIAIACGGAQKSAMRSAPPPGAEHAPIAAGPAGLDNPRAEIEKLDREIDGELAKLGIAKPEPPPAGTDIKPMSVSSVPSSQDPTCKAAPSEKCKSSCELSDAICKASARICTIAGDLGGNDAYANEKCATGQKSCDRAHTSCCSCM